jgi:hypothetical protein
LRRVRRRCDRNIRRFPAGKDGPPLHDPGNRRRSAGVFRLTPFRFRSERAASEPETKKTSSEPILLSANRIPDSLLAKVESRDVALWVRRLRGPNLDRSSFVKVLGLPWALVICEDYDDQIFSELQAADSSDEVMVRRRGLVQILDRDPSKIPGKTRPASKRGSGTLPCLNSSTAVRSSRSW